MTDSPLKEFLDGLAAVIAALSLVDILPALAAGFSAIWLGTRIYEQFTGRPFRESKLARWFTGRGSGPSGE